MAKESVRTISSFFAGINRDDKANIVGSGFNFEEIDIFTNKDFIQAEQIMTADSMPASTEVYAYDVAPDDTIYAYGKETSASKVRLLSMASAGNDNPGTFATLFTSADATNLATTVSDIKFHRTSESPTDYLYYISGASSTWLLKRYSISGASEATVGTLTGLTGSFDRPTMRRFFGELYVCNGQYIAKVDDAGVFTEKAFTLPNGQEAVDILPVGDVAIILSKDINRFTNSTIGYWWDLESSTGFDDRFHIPIGGPQWIANYREAITICCAINGIAKFFQLSGAFPGGKPIELPGKTLTNVGIETSTQPVSPSKSVSQKDGILYFGLFKTDKTAIYALGQLDETKPLALILSKRFSTGDYSTHKPTALLIHGPNYYAAYYDGTNNVNARCETRNSPDRSSNAVYESLWVDAGDALVDKDLTEVFLQTYPLPTSTSLATSVASDYSSSYTAITRPDGTAMNDTSDVLGFFQAKQTKKKVYRIKVAFTSSTTSSPKLVQIGMRLVEQTTPAVK